jgi:hypothetical protein
VLLSKKRRIELNNEQRLLLYKQHKHNIIPRSLLPIHHVKNVPFNSELLLNNPTYRQFKNTHRYVYHFQIPIYDPSRARPSLIYFTFTDGVVATTRHMAHRKIDDSKEPLFHGVVAMDFCNVVRTITLRLPNKVNEIPTVNTETGHRNEVKDDIMQEHFNNSDNCIVLFDLSNTYGGTWVRTTASIPFPNFLFNSHIVAMTKKPLKPIAAFLMKLAKRETDRCKKYKGVTHRLATSTQLHVFEEHQPVLSTIQDLPQIGSPVIIPHDTYTFSFDGDDNYLFNSNSDFFGAFEL